jgi:WD40 repeat protein
MMNPYPGLRPFQESDHDFFFGREQEIDDLLGRLSAGRLLAVLGVSGSGKSSLVRAGLIPLLRSELADPLGGAWRIVTFCPGESPIESLDRALNTALPRRSHALRDWVCQQNSNEKVLILVDQFEEIFTYRDRTIDKDGGNAAALFVDILLTAVQDPRAPLYLVITMRTDYLGQAAVFRDLAEALNDNHYLLPRMTRLQQQTAIEAPAESLGVTPQPALVQRLLNDSQEDPDKLPVLQHLLKRLWEERKDGPLDVEVYTRVGGWEHALDWDAEAVLARFPSEQQGIQRMFQCLTDPGLADRPARRRCPTSEIPGITGLEPKLADSIIEAFECRDLLQRENGATGAIVYLTHESVMWQWRKLKRWISAEAIDRSRLVFYSEAARKKLVLSGTTLEEARAVGERIARSPGWATRYLHSDDEQRTTISWIQRCRRARNQRRTLLVGAILLFIALGALYLRKLESDKAKIISARNSAVASTLAAEAALTVSSSPSKALVYGWWSARLGSRTTPPTLPLALKRIFHKALLQPVRVPFPDRVIEFAWSPDGDHQAWARSDGRIVIWNSETRQEEQSLPDLKGVSSLIFSRDGSRLVIGSSRSVWVWDWKSNQAPLELKLSGNLESLAWDFEKNRLAAGETDGSLEIWNLGDGRTPLVPRRKLHNGGIKAVAWSPDGSMLATASADKTVAIWDLDALTAVGDTAQPSSAASVLGHSAGLYAMAWSPDGKGIATADVAGVFSVWKRDSTGWKSEKPEEGRHIRAIAWSMDGSSIATVGSDGLARIWDAGDLTARLVIQTLQGVLDGVVWSPHGRYMATVSQTGSVTAWGTVGTGEFPTLVHALSPGEQLTRMAWSDATKNSRLATSTSGGALNIWSSDIGRNKPIVAHQGCWISAISWSPGGSKLASACRGNGTVRVYGLREKEKPTFRDYSLTRQTITGIAWLPDESQLIIAGDKETVVLDITTGETSKHPFSSGEGIRFLAHDRTSHIAATTRDGTVLVLNDKPTSHTWPNRTADARPNRRGLFFSGIAWSGSRHALVTADQQTAKIWNLENQAQSCELASGNNITSVAWSPASEIATGSIDGITRVWRGACPGDLRLELEGHVGRPIRSVAWSPDGKKLASADQDGIVKIYAIDDELLINVVAAKLRLDLALTDQDCTRMFQTSCENVGIDVGEIARSASVTMEDLTDKQPSTTKLFCSEGLGVSFEYSSATLGVLEQSSATARFASPDNKFRLTVSNERISEGTRLAGDLERRFGALKDSCCGSKEPYKRLRDNWYVISGCSQGVIYYEKVLQGGQFLKRIRAESLCGEKTFNYMPLFESVRLVKECQ